jgi:RNA polymerase sigma-70 factor (ECF subfamily)
MQSEDIYELTTQDAIRRVQGGETAAFEAIVRHFERPLRAWLAGHAPPGIDVDEIAQQSFIAAYSSLADFSAGTNFASWLFTIAKYQLRTETTRLRRLADYHSRYAPVLLQQALEASGQEGTELWDTRLGYLQECIKQLGKDLSQYLTWRYHDQIPIEEMANSTGRSVSAVKKQLWSLRQKLLKCIESRAAMSAGESS